MKFSACLYHNLLTLLRKISTINTLFMISGKLSEKKSITNPELKNVMKLFHQEKIIPSKVSVTKLSLLKLLISRLYHQWNFLLTNLKMLHRNLKLWVIKQKILKVTNFLTHFSIKNSSVLSSN